jgi:hypothetical protein
VLETLLMVVKLKTVRTDDEIHDAVEAWSASKHAEEEKYGSIDA